MPEKSIFDVLEDFESDNKPKVKHLIDRWPACEPGKRELLFKLKRKTIFRAGPYEDTKNKLYLTSHIQPEIRVEIETKLGKFHREGDVEAMFYLDRLSIDQLDEFLRIMAKYF